MPIIGEDNIRPFPTRSMWSDNEEVPKKLEMMPNKLSLSQAIEQINQKFKDLLKIEKDIEQIKESKAKDASFFIVETIEDIGEKIETKNSVIKELVDTVQSAMVLLGSQETPEVPFLKIVALLSGCINDMDLDAQEFRAHNFGNEVARFFKDSIQDEQLMFGITSTPYFTENVIKFAGIWAEKSLNRDAALRYGLSCRGSNHLQVKGNIDKTLLKLAKQLIECMLKRNQDINNIKNNLKASDVVVFLAYGSLDGRNCFAGIQKEYIEGYGHADFFFCDIVRYILVSAGIPCYSDLLLQDYFGNDIFPEWLIPKNDQRFIDIFTNWCEKAASFSSHMVMFGSPVYGDKTRNAAAVCHKEWQAFKRGRELQEDALSLVLISDHRYDAANKVLIDCASDQNFIEKCFPEEVKDLVYSKHLVDYRHSTSNSSTENILYKQKFETAVRFAFSLINKLTAKNTFRYYDGTNEWSNLFDKLNQLNVEKKSELSQPDQLADGSNVVGGSSLLFRSPAVVKDVERQTVADDGDLGITREATKLSSPKARNVP